MSSSETPPRRADAERNRDKIVAAARVAFADAGADISMAEISRRAGVGMATLYRNFPGRRELLEALYLDEVDAICAAATESAETPGAALTVWLRRFFDFVTSKRQILPELLTHTGHDAAVFGESRARGLDAGRPLLAAAQRTGEIRADVTIDQVLDLVVAIATIHGDTGYVEPIMRAALDGLRA